MITTDKLYGMIDRVPLDFKQMNVSSRSISNEIGGQIAKDIIYLSASADSNLARNTSASLIIRRIPRRNFLPNS